MLARARAKKLSSAEGLFEAFGLTREGFEQLMQPLGAEA
jgi:hypothetical protein